MVMCSMTILKENDLRLKYIFIFNNTCLKYESISNYQ